jgi:hypothetical protein
MLYSIGLVANLFGKMACAGALAQRITASVWLLLPVQMFAPARLARCRARAGGRCSRPYCPSGPDQQGPSQSQVSHVAFNRVCTLPIQ